MRLYDKTFSSEEKHAERQIFLGSETPYFTSSSHVPKYTVVKGRNATLKCSVVGIEYHTVRKPDSSDIYFKFSE